MNESGLILPDGTTQTTAINSLSDLSVTATATELNLLDGVTATTAEINKLDGVTSSIQTQLDAKLASSSYTAADVLTKIKTVDGNGSGLDADLLDGLGSGQFLRSDAADSFSGTLTFTTNNGVIVRSGGSGSTDTTLWRCSANSTTNDSADYGFSIKYMGSRSGNDNSYSIFSDNSTAGTQVEAFQIKQDGSITLGDDLTVTGTLTGDGSGLTNLSISTTFPFYKADGTSDTIAVTNGSFPFYKADGTQDNIGVS